jgi:hypothetical protein
MAYLQTLLGIDADREAGWRKALSPYYREFGNIRSAARLRPPFLGQPLRSHRCAPKRNVEEVAIFRRFGQDRIPADAATYPLGN